MSSNLLRELTLCQVMAASISLEAGVNKVTYDTVPHVTCFTNTLTLSRSNVVTVGVGAAASSTLQLTVVDLQAHFAVTCPTLITHTRRVTWAQMHTLCVGVAASSVALQAEVDGRTGVTITLISIPTHTHSVQSCLCAVCVDVTVFLQSIRVAGRGSPVAIVSGVSLHTGSSPTNTTTAWTVIAHAMDTMTLFITLVSVLGWILTDVAGNTLKAWLTAARAVPMDTVKTRSFVVAGMLESSNTGFTVRTVETFTTLCYRFGGIAEFGAACTECRPERGCDVITATLMSVHFSGSLWALSLIQVIAVNTWTHDDLAFDDITAVRQDGED